MTRRLLLLLFLELSSFQLFAQAPAPLALCDDRILGDLLNNLLAFAKLTPQPADFDQQFRAQATAFRLYQARPLGKIAKNQEILFCFEYGENERSQVKFFRLRRAQTIAGAFSELVRLAPSTTSYAWRADRNSFLFLTVVYEVKDTSGNVVETVETPGSNMVAVQIDPALPPVP